MEKPPCKECTIRNAICHQNCKAYIEYAERVKAEREARAKAVQSKNDFRAVRRDRVRTIAINNLPANKRKNR